MKKIISIALLAVMMLSSVAVYASPGMIDVELNGTTYELALCNYSDGLEELYEEKQYLNPYIYPEEDEKNKEIEKKIEEIYETEATGVRLDFQDGALEKAAICPDLVLFPAMSNKYPADEYYKNMDWEGTPVIHAGLKYFDTNCLDNIKTIIIENGIISAEIVALNDFPQLTSVVIPESINQIFIDGTNKYYEKKLFNTTLHDYFGVTREEFRNYPVQDSDGTTFYAINPKYKDAVNDLSKKHDKTENKICALASNNKVTFYVKANSYAAQYLSEIGLNVQCYVSVKYDDKEIFSDQPAVIVDGRTLVPLRAIFEAMGASVEWNNDTRTAVAKRKNTEISLQIDSDQLYINGEAKTIDVPAKLINGRTMVPARAVAEAFGCDVKWDDVTKTVLITK